MVTNMESKYKSGDKFIIEIDSEYCKHDDFGGFRTDKPLYHIKGFNSLVFDETGLKKLKKYSEPNIEDIHKDGYKEGYQYGYQYGYEKGLNDAWEAAYKIIAPIRNGGFDGDTLKKIFDEGNQYEIIKNYTAKIAVEKIKNYEDIIHIEDMIHIGDEVTAYGLKFIVTEIDDNSIGGIDVNGNIFTYIPNECTKTGKHNDKLVALLKELQNDESTNSTKE